MIENQKGSKIKIIRIDNGLEFCNKEFAHLCKQDGILRHLLVPGNPKQKGLAERMNRTLLERVRCMIIHARLSKSFWGEALSTITYVIKRSPSVAIGFKTPYEMWIGHKPNIDHIKVFGCIAYAHSKQGKLDPRAIGCLFIGHPEGVKGYKLWSLDPNMPKTFASRDVTFDEGSNIKDFEGKEESKDAEIEKTVDVDLPEES